ncbi:MAG: GNAT family N-acetyltransferase [Dinoroseobacter sp.]|nr:GNAT family N-acetyltransferase [Dinoroseobacter sp.]
MSLEVRAVEPGDWPGVWAMLEPVFRAGETYAISPEILEAEARAYWFAPERTTFVAQDGAALLGTYYLVANFAGNADHICNCGYVTAAAARGRGVARAMLAHSLTSAREAGFKAMQYNCVVSTNQRAVDLWLANGFSIIGTIPDAFRHPRAGVVEAHVMYRKL